ncbi:Proton myo-inositol cotransporter [Frankliniella fusca]|uniref:Proton myo-inositol cotransporter n=1 Tax=Frankliniella fusca TaxID=407009 RepID=A0AAE1H3J6_9NEOP|nr:Proton myo-inositol cotransporter [Frankliniella fusca]
MTTKYQSNVDMTSKEDLLSERGLKRRSKFYVFTLTILSTLGGFLFGYDTGVVSGAMLLINKDFDISPVWHELIVSSTIAAALVFSLVGGWFSDRFGRKKAILVSGVIFTGGAIIMGAASSKEILLVGRIIIGVAVGITSVAAPQYLEDMSSRDASSMPSFVTHVAFGQCVSAIMCGFFADVPHFGWRAGFESMSVPVYIAECSDPARRGMLVTAYQLFITLGLLAASIIAGLYSTVYEGWRYMLGLAAVPSAIQFLGFCLMPESPRWLAGQKRYNEANKVLKAVRGSSAVADQELAAIKATIEDKEREMEAFFRSSGVRRALFIGFCLQIFQQLSGINTVMYYSASIIRMSGIRDESMAIWISAGVSAVNFVFTLMGLFVVERAGRRKLTLISYAGVICSLVLLGVGFSLMNSDSPLVTQVDKNDICGNAYSCQECINIPDGCGFCFVKAPGNGSILGGSCWKLDPNTGNPSEGQCSEKGIMSQYPKDIDFARGWCPTKYFWLPILAMTLYLVSFAPGMGPMPWTINSEIYPLWARGFCSSITTSASWLGNLIISASFLSLIEALGNAGAFFLYVGIALVGFSIMFAFLPETQGRTLEEMESLFLGPALVCCRRRKSGSTLGSNNVQYVHIRGLNRASPRSSTRPGELGSGADAYNSDDSDN